MHVGIAYPRWRGKRSWHSRRMRTRNFTYLARGPCMNIWWCNITSHVKMRTRWVMCWHVICIIYRQTSNIRRALLGNEFVDHSDVVGAIPVRLLQPHLDSRLNAWLQLIGQRQLQDQTRNIYVLGFGASYVRGLMVHGRARLRWNIVSGHDIKVWTKIYTKRHPSPPDFMPCFASMGRKIIIIWITFRRPTVFECHLWTRDRMFVP